jgi:hypothetical protein
VTLLWVSHFIIDSYVITLLWAKHIRKSIAFNAGITDEQAFAYMFSTPVGSILNITIDQLQHVAVLIVVAVALVFFQ